MSVWGSVDVKRLAGRNIDTVISVESGIETSRIGNRW